MPDHDRGAEMQDTGGRINSAQEQGHQPTTALFQLHRRVIGTQNTACSERTQSDEFGYTTLLTVTNPGNMASDNSLSIMMAMRSIGAAFCVLVSFFVKRNANHNSIKPVQ